MATLASVVKNEKRKKMIASQAKKRKLLKANIIDDMLSDDSRDLAMRKLQKLNRNGSSVRYRSRCLLTGRSRGVYQKFGLSRMKFRELALQGLIPGVTKASW
ncbi:MAG: 30S ribosomal protein S14 [Bacteriovoracaceae bacterium]|nr:30S ribosomal protein S14 [Bacteriovoracaceae bacterium]